MHVIGTAGHVDHGKSTLVRALTGIDPDRLKEEKAREMTIDLGFAWLTLPDGQSVGIIDVPGHRDFIENMLAGVGGINAVIFVVAADEGVMPQTREHLAIVDLLRIPTGLIALTKIDLVHDPDWLDLVQLDLAEVTRNTVLGSAPMIPLSARTGVGLDQLRQALVTMLDSQAPAPDLSRPRLWVDRVFSISGFGTVVTGTLLDGQLYIGQEIEIQPTGLHGRVRGLQSHHQTLEIALPGNRVAVNIGGVDKNEVRRGNLISLPALIASTQTTAVYFHHLPDATRPLRHNAEVKFFCGAAETVARVRLLDTDVLPPGSDGWLQLDLRDPVPLVKGDRFILRYPSPGETIGGGDVIDPSAGKRWRRNRPEVIAQLETLARGDPSELIVQALETSVGPLTLSQLTETIHLDARTIINLLEDAVSSGKVIQIGHDSWIGMVALKTLFERLTHILTGFHNAEPLRTGIKPDNLRRQLGIDRLALESVIDAAVERGLVSQTAAGTIALPGHGIRLSKAQRAAIERLMEAFAQAPYTPPSYKESAALVGEDVLSALIETGELRQLAPDVLLRPGVFSEFVAETRRQLSESGKIDVKALRDRFNTSRKYALAALEYFDSMGLTRRSGDDHILASNDWSIVAS